MNFNVQIIISHTISLRDYGLSNRNLLHAQSKKETSAFLFSQSRKTNQIGGQLKSQVGNVVNVNEFNRDFDCADGSDESQGLTLCFYRVPTHFYSFYSHKIVGCRSLILVNGWEIAVLPFSA